MTDRWQDIKEFYSVQNQAGDDTLFLVKGKFDNKPAIGIYWNKYAKSAPLVLEKSIAIALLTGLLNQNLNTQNKLLDAIEFIK